ncbi:MAG: DNA polymerase III subunit beta [Deltaproteobacteria bacterium]|nr:DNA polymerase III subunit beta [Deltaproteobacteria bacterium]
MKFQITKDNFLKSLSKIQGVAERRSTMPILSNVLIEAREKNLTLTTTDLEVGIRAQSPAEVEMAGSIAVSAKHLYDIVKELPNDTIKAQSTDLNRLLLVCGKGEFQIVGVSAHDFPKLADYSTLKFYSIKRDALEDMILKTSFSISNDEARQHLNGIFMESAGDSKTGKRVRMVATDGHRLSMIEKSQQNIHSDIVLKQGVIFPKKGVYELRKIFDESEESIQMAVTDHEAIFISNSVALFMRLIDGKYPNYNQVIPADHKKKIYINRVDLMNSLKRVSLLSSEKSKGVKLTIRGKEMTISSVHPELGEAKEDLLVRYDGPQMEIGFNAKYLIDALSAHDGDEVCLELEDRLSPGVIRSSQDQKHICVIMPMRLN